MGKKRNMESKELSSSNNNDGKNNRLTIIIGIGVVVAIVVTAGLIFIGTQLSKNSNNDKGFIIAGTEIKGKDYKKLLDQAKAVGKTEDEAKKIIIRSVKAKDIATNNKITVTDAALNQRSETMYEKPYQELNDWQQSDVYVGDVLDQAYFIDQGGYYGYQLNFPFSENYGMYGNNVLKSPEEIEKARLAAESTAKDTQSSLRTNPMSINSVITTLTTQKPYDYGYGFSLNLSGEVMMSEDGRVFNLGGGETSYQNLDDQLVQAMKKLNPGDISDILPETANITGPDTAKDNPYFGKDLLISYRLMYLKDKVIATPGIYDTVIADFNAITVEEAK